MVEPFGAATNHGEYPSPINSTGDSHLRTSGVLRKDDCPYNSDQSHRSRAAIHGDGLTILNAARAAAC
jgi:hypothetical protein